MNTTYRIYDNDEEHDHLATITKKEQVFRFFQGKHPELYSITESDDTDDAISTLNGELWLQENACPCCGQTREPPLTEEEAQLLDELRPGPHY